MMVLTFSIHPFSQGVIHLDKLLLYERFVLFRTCKIPQVNMALSTIFSNLHEQNLVSICNHVFRLLKLSASPVQFTKERSE